MHNLLPCLVFFAIVMSVSAQDYYDNYLDKRDISTLEKLSNLEERQVAAQALMPGQVIFSYGSGIPTVVCALFEITDISLEKGERVYSVQLGDSVRWNLDSAVSGSGAARTEHIIVKALDNGLKTSLIIATNRRTYHISLKSSERDFMPAVSFNYPQSKLKINNHNYDYQSTSPRFDYSLASSDNYESESPYSKAAYTTSESLSSGGPSSGRNYSYKVEGDDSILPVNIFDDGTSTYIQLPSAINHEDLPTVFRVNKAGLPLLGKDKTSILNFRVDDHTFIIDGIYDHLRLVSGSDDSSVCADIIRES